MQKEVKRVVEETTYLVEVINKGELSVKDQYEITVESGKKASVKACDQAMKDFCDLYLLETRDFLDTYWVRATELKTQTIEYKMNKEDFLKNAIKCTIE